MLHSAFKRTLAVGLAALTLTLGAAGCGSRVNTVETGADNTAQTASGAGTASAAASDTAKTDSQADKIRVGIIQYMEHPSLDQAYRGFVEGLKQAGYVDGQNLELNFQNAQGEQANCQTIADQFKNADYDMILAIATPAALAVANVIADTPILVTAVTDLVSTQLVQSNEAPGTNISGTSDMTPIDDQIKLVQTLFPDCKNLGIIYSSGEANSELQVAEARKAAEALGMTVKAVTISSTNEIQQVTESVITGLDAIYLPSDNAIASSMPTIAKVAMDHKVPIIPAVEAMCAEGGLASVSINYLELGRQTAAMATRILRDGEDVAAMPVEFAANPELVINQEYANAIGYTFSADIQSRARAAAAE